MLFHCPVRSRIKVSDRLALHSSAQALARLPPVDGAVAAVAGVADGLLEPFDHVVVGVVEGDRPARKRGRETSREMQSFIQRA